LIVKRLRQTFQAIGGDIRFETPLTSLHRKDSTIIKAVTPQGDLDADLFIIAPGHSAYDTYRMLISSGVKFRTKNFAIGARLEHPQELINQAQWGQPSLPGLLAAEYRLTSTSEGHLPVYTFCMCPGGRIVPAMASPHLSVVNGMSLQKRDGLFANAACVAAVNIDTSPLAALNWIENLERQFYDFSDGYRLPACTIHDFIAQKVTSDIPSSSYPLGLDLAPLWEMFPENISASIQSGLINFSRKLKGFETGSIMGLESKTSAPIQALREQNLRCVGFDNLYMAGEGSGHSGGIVSSAADGINIALSIIGEASS
jgi:uncharacterized FAD-dependent dehydrogenase